ncbi:MAG: rbsA [Anaerosolibacter sp.]|uniref:ribose ABC transporter ATP-binding protein RbsA n=1 Tax=Anaerosolibacter sp. TaxID=1872527 RepID=UPI002608595F|nr:ribose ABC transporter ATP-binding protein RbsA [Anaerosolibacter sp.]MDF2547840.1 rbsA [Anaerosolibacter sp.]
MAKPLLQMKGITKEFPGVKALDQIDFNIYEGKVMALLGENGAGKSTLMKILSGVYQMDEGELYFKENHIKFKTPRDSQDVGIAIIHQELNLVPQLTIGENIFLGREPVNKFKRIDWKKLYANSSKLLERLGIEKDPMELVSNLSIGEQQMVEIAKALSLDAKIIIMDEPTDALTDKETAALFKVINELRENGCGIVYISHRLKEIFEICDMATVLRDGKFITEDLVTNLNEDLIIEAMVGRKLEEQFPRVDVELKEVVLEVKNLSNEYIEDISFTLRKGEIIGIAGLMGSGRTELAKTIFGSLPVREGEVFIDQKQYTISSPKSALEHGIAYVSEDRKGQGLILDLSVKENMSLSDLKQFESFLFKLNGQNEEHMVRHYIDNMSIRTPSMDQTVKNLSGGNQQKVSIAKGLMTKPKILILDEPTRGVDVGAKKEIYNLINQFKKEGMSIIIISSELPEVLGMCDRILVMFNGKITGAFNRKEASQEQILRCAVGIEEA